MSEVISKIMNEYVDQGRISIRDTNLNGINYHIFCYTKDQFFNHEWDDVTITHRGKIYTDSGVVVNNPFPKIFNLNEHESTKIDRVLNLIQTHQFEVLDKVNGHLTIVSPDIVNGNVLVSTKGSFSGELAELDCKLVSELGIDKVIVDNQLDYTFMFECLADYDQHLWYKDQKQRYGVEKNTLILLGAISNTTQESLPHEDLVHFANILGVPVTKRLAHFESRSLDIDRLFEDRGIEGYVFHFPELNFRFKIKTKEYVTLHYMKELTSDKIVNKLYNSGFENMYVEYDEELYPVIDALAEDFTDFLMRQVARLDGIDVSNWSPKEIAMNKDLNNYERMMLLNSKNWFNRARNSKTVRKEFRETNYFPKTEEKIQSFFKNKLYSL